MNAVLFDFGRVLGNFNKESAFQRLAASSPYSASEISQIIARRDLEKTLESGEMSETAFANELLHHIKSNLTVPDVLRIWGNIISPNPAIEPYVDELIKRKVRIGILSNTSPIHWAYIADLPIMQKLARYGAPITLSYEVRASKPDRKIFDTALQRLGKPADETLYLDDVKEYVDRARVVGMQAELYDCTLHSASRLKSIFAEHHVL